jgi:xanthine dehydrogenase accessory factor
MSDWLDDLSMLGTGTGAAHNMTLARSPQPCVLISVVRTRGSCPREAGTRMIVTLDSCHGTIGGGHLEYQAIGIARDLLFGATPAFRIERFPLGARLGQCCGGVAHLSFEFIPVDSPTWVAALKDIRDTGQAAIMVTSVDRSAEKLIVTRQACAGSIPDTDQHQLAVSRALELLSKATQIESIQEGMFLYESFDNKPIQVAIFGAGHVGKALVNVLSSMPCRINWIDSRASEFPDQVPANLQVVITDKPEGEVDDLPTASHVVIMTHSHALDRAICERALRRDDLAWCGLIGSITKRRQFEKRLLAKGLSDVALTRLTCPIGIEGITSKHPTEIAISVAAQLLLSVHAQQRVAVPDHQAA